MTDKDSAALALFRVLGLKLYELQTGFAAMFALNVGRVFTPLEFQQVKSEIEQSPDMKKLRSFLDKLADPTEPVDFEKLLREFEGPVQ